ncbi:MAG: hypothetical protein J0I17_03220 ['Candidatus Kapabacteria' thiocyanatum]|nr:hypothetical protein ['Candidatus Kapabacteria' thiocyanatum]
MSTSVRRCHGSVVVMLIAIASIVLGTVATSAQSVCTCTPALSITRQITICFNGAQRQVEVTYCNESFCPPSTQITDHCNAQNLPIDARTVIKRICPIGFATTNAQGLMNATIAAIGLCCNNQGGIFECQPSTVYHWIVRWPKCVYFDATGCLEACDDTPCCHALVRFRPNSPTPGRCETTVLTNCSENLECPPSPVNTCIKLDCIYPVTCCW